MIRQRAQSSSSESDDALRADLTRNLSPAAQRLANQGDLHITRLVGSSSSVLPRHRPTATTNQPSAHDRPARLTVSVDHSTEDTTGRDFYTPAATDAFESRASHLEVDVHLDKKDKSPTVHARADSLPLVLPATPSLQGASPKSQSRCGLFAVPCHWSPNVRVMSGMAQFLHCRCIATRLTWCSLALLGTESSMGLDSSRCGS